MQKASFFANARSKYFLVAIDQAEFFGGIDHFRFAYIPYLGFSICLYYDMDDLFTEFERRDCDQYFDDEYEKRLMAPYQGIAVSATCNCEPLHIPSDTDVRRHDLETMRHGQVFVVAIWKRDGTAVTHLYD